MLIRLLSQETFVNAAFCVQLFKEPLESKEGESAALLNPTELRIIFGNLPPIYEVHRDMLAELQRAAASWRDDTTKVGAILLNYVSYWPARKDIS